MANLENQIEAARRHADKASRFLPARAVTERYGISRMSLWRWLQDPTLGFPRPISPNGRHYFRLSEIEAWEAEQARKASDDHAV